MSHGKVARARRRYPDAKRRAARYGRTPAGRRPTGLPPHLLPGITGRSGASGAKRLYLAVGGVVLVVLATIGALVTSVASGSAGVGGTLVAYREVNEGLQDASKVAVNTNQTTRITDRDGKLLQEIADPKTGWRTFVPLDKVSPHLIRATIAAEDATFWTHRGVEPIAIGRGLVINLLGSGSSGGSTITQQLVRSLHPEKIGNDYSYTRKGKEALAAVAVERDYSKTDILTMYLNLIFYGNHSYGIEAASETFFHKRAADLTLSEASLLAGLPQKPTTYNPSENLEEAKKRQRYVLNQMAKLEYITPAEADAAHKEMPTIHPARDGNGAVLAHEHFVTYVRDYLEVTYGRETMRRGGLTITTTIDTAVQERAEDIIENQVATVGPYNVQNGAMVAMVPHTGEILAMVGSASFSNDLIQGQVNITTSDQQPGSAIKPVVYAAAFEQGWHPGTVVLDAPFREETQPYPDPVTGQMITHYEPQNYLRTFNGAVPIRTALSNSLNIPAVKAAQYAGVDAVIDLARRMGIKHQPERDPSDFGLSVALGASEVWPLDLTNVYATFANNGKYVPANPILKITDSLGNTLYELDRKRALEQAEQVLRAEYAYQITSILTDSNARRMIFGAGNLFEVTQDKLGRPTAAKSGTTNDFRDVWTMGYTSDLAVGVWVGNTDNEALKEIDGIQGAGPAWALMMEEMHNRPEFAELLTGPTGQPLAKEFPRPAGIVEGPVCNATGGRPTEQGGNHTELLARGGGPTLRCDQLSAFARADLGKTLKNVRERGGNFAGGGAADSINRYARAVRFTNGPGFEQYYPPPSPEEE